MLIVAHMLLGFPPAIQSLAEDNASMAPKAAIVQRGVELSETAGHVLDGRWSAGLLG